jgi:hypothetical protein
MSQSDPLAVAVAVDNVEANAEAHAEPQSNQIQADTFSKLERLVLAQAVYELGSDAWTSVSSILSQHPLIPKRDDVPFSPSVSRSSLHLILLFNPPLYHAGLPEHLSPSSESCWARQVAHHPL